MRYWFVIGAMVLCVLVLSGCGGSGKATDTGVVAYRERIADTHQ